MARPGAQLVQDAGVIICINSTSEHKELALEYVLHLFSDASQRIFTEDLGLLPPLVDSTLPMDSYPVLEDIRDALSNPGIDPELHIPSRYISDLQYRLDDLLINTREITVDEYLIKLRDELRLY